MPAAPASRADAPDLDTPSGVLAFARQQRAAADLAEARLMVAAVEWCVQHAAETVDRSEWSDGFGDRAVGLAGDGAPLVSEFAVAEFAAAVGRSTDGGRAYLAQALELRYRLPRVWGLVLDGDLPAWKARRIADRTTCLPLEAATFVDRHVTPVAATISTRALDRLVEEALVRYDPEAAEAQRRSKAGGRHLDVHLSHVSFDGHVDVTGTLDVADAVDLDDALARGAAHLAELGCTEPLDVRRAMAAGDLARRQLVLELGAEPKPLVVHVHQTAEGEPDPLVRVEATRSFVLVDQLRAWCEQHAGAGSPVTVKPVIDLRDRIAVGAYEVPDRIAEHVRARDHSCVFPWCERPATSSDLDHRIPHGEGGPTSTDNLAPLCRRHHRLKTHGGWTYTSPAPGTYLWSSPHRQYFQVERGTTLDLTPPSGPPS